MARSRFGPIFIATFVEERDRADRAEADLRAERAARITDSAATEARVRELEAVNRRLRGE